jgi:hypothetical protein
MQDADAITDALLMDPSTTKAKKLAAVRTAIATLTKVLVRLGAE